MKKNLSFILVMIMLFTFVGCATAPQEQIDTTAESESRILGRWEFEKVDVCMVFNENHTGRMMSISDETNGANIRWSYDAAADVYHIYVEGKAYVYYCLLDDAGNLVYNGETAAKNQ